jgi:hypothetical protein
MLDQDLLEIIDLTMIDNGKSTDFSCDCEVALPDEQLSTYQVNDAIVSAII